MAEIVSRSFVQRTRPRYRRSMLWLLIGSAWVLIWLGTRWDIPGFVEFIIVLAIIQSLIGHTDGVVDAWERTPKRRTAVAWFALWFVLAGVGVAASITDDYSRTVDEVNHPWGTEVYVSNERSILGIVYEQNTYLAHREFAEPIETRSTVVETRSCTSETRIRTGAICHDGWQSSSTGSGTCSHHGGVRDWTYKLETRTTPCDVEVELTVTVPPQPPPPGLMECSNAFTCANY